MIDPDAPIHRNSPSQDVLQRLTIKLDGLTHNSVQCHDYPPPGHSIARFPFLYWPPQAETYAIYTLWDSWRFTTTWTLVLYAIFHLAAAVAAIVMQIGKTRSTWKFIWAVPLVYALIAGFEATIAGSVVGLV